MPGMDETALRRLLDSALADRPPMGPVVHNALRAGRKRRRHRIQGAASGLAAAAVVAVAIPAAIGGPGHTARPAAGHRPAGLAGGPEFFAGITQKPSRTVLNIYRSATGRVTGSIRPPGPYHDFSAVSRLGGDRTFVAAAITSFSQRSCSSHLFRFSIDGQGHPSPLTPLSVPQVTGLVGEFVSSANGKALAYTIFGCARGRGVGLINLATRQTTIWTVADHGRNPMTFGSLSLTGDGSKLGFTSSPEGSANETNAYVLPTDSPSGSLMRHATKVLHVPTGVFRVVLSYNGAQAYVETGSALHGGAVILTEYSITTGRRIHLICQLSPRNLGEFSVTVDAAGKHLLVYDYAHRLTAVNLTTGHRASVTVAQVPFLDTPYDTAAW
jgi:hypothetical protein